MICKDVYIKGNVMLDRRNQPLRLEGMSRDCLLQDPAQSQSAGGGYPGSNPSGIWMPPTVKTLLWVTGPVFDLFHCKNVFT